MNTNIKAITESIQILIIKNDNFYKLIIINWYKMKKKSLIHIGLTG